MMLRAKYNLKGSVCTDFCIHCWCQCLALGQVYREARAWADAEEDGTVFHAPHTQAPAPQEMKGVDEPRQDNSRLGMTPTDRYQDLLADINALTNTNLGKKSSKTSTDMGDQVMGSVVVRGDSFGSHDAKETALASMSVSAKALELHTNFADEDIDSSRLLKTPTGGARAESSGSGGEGANPLGLASAQPQSQPLTGGETPTPDPGPQESGLTEAKSIAEVGEVGKLVKAAGSGHYVVKQPQSIGKGGVLSLGQGDPRMIASMPAVPAYTTPPLVKAGSAAPQSRTSMGEVSEARRPAAPPKVSPRVNPNDQSS